MIKKLSKMLYLAICIAAISTVSLIGIVSSNIDNNYKIIKGNPLFVSTSLPITAEYKGTVVQNSDLINSVGEKFNVNIKLFGIFPVTQTNVEVVDETYCAILGTPFGVKIYTDGVLVIDIKDVLTGDGYVSPGKNAGLKVGDSIVLIDGQTVTSNEDVSEIIENSSGKSLNLSVKRDGEIVTLNLQPEFSVESGSYKAGIWVRDSSAGIGTLTFFSPATNTLCGLGHGICDEDTGNLLDFSTGELVNAEIVSVVKGVAGSPGELKGKFENVKIGNLISNCDLGVYGDACCNIDLKNLTKIALKQEIYEGNATIVTTVDGNTPKEYSCIIKLKSSISENKTRNFVVKITDKELLNITGGIIQGMSGSPILQNGKLIGAVTHVLVDDPTTGYGIFAENMLESAQNFANSEIIKDAS